jgi:hypothetical protein
MAPPHLEAAPSDEHDFGAGQSLNLPSFRFTLRDEDSRMGDVHQRRVGYLANSGSSINIKGKK